MYKYLYLLVIGISLPYSMATMPLSHKDGEDLKQLRTKIEMVWKQPTRGGRNVHSVTSTLAPQAFNLGERLLNTYSADNALRPKPHTPQDLLTEIETFYRSLTTHPERMKTILKLVMSRIEHYLNDPIDQETHLNIGDVLNKTWAITAGDQAAREMVCLNLIENIIENGGCQAGITGRLCFEYFHHVQERLKL